jgi:hypothetical protein
MPEPEPTGVTLLFKQETLPVGAEKDSADRDWLSRGAEPRQYDELIPATP